ncbi:MAG: TIGR04255 family protein [Candidatus Hydrogenedentes bacterium]|nr:TIGR04255 family protein [Candidatus Hydrogenedentota bacterium]
MGDSRLPKSISPCPISEAIVEVRYESSAPAEAVFGMIYNSFRSEFPQSEKLPILQVPEQLRSQDPNLMYLPEYRLSQGTYHLLIGPRSFGLATVGAYAGWHEFSGRLMNALERLQTLDVVESVVRVGLRYINTFKGNVFDQSTLQILRHGHPLETNESQLIASISAGEFKHTLRVISNVEIKSKEESFIGSAIDIDTALEGKRDDFFQNMPRYLEDAHLEEKRLFFSLLTDEYVESLNPEY